MPPKTGSREDEEYGGEERSLRNQKQKEKAHISANGWVRQNLTKNCLEKEWE